MSAAAADHDEPQIHVTTTDKLVYMANQIATFFASQGREETAILSTADHIKSYWDPTMRRGIFAHLDATGGAGLSPVALGAVERIRKAAPGSIRAGLDRAGLSSGRGPGDDAG